jgi:hypothetical protein
VIAMYFSVVGCLETAHYEILGRASVRRSGATKICDGVCCAVPASRKGREEWGTRTYERPSAIGLVRPLHYGVMAKSRRGCFCQGRYPAKIPLNFLVDRDYDVARTAASFLSRMRS